MLSSLTIRDFAIIDRVTLELGPGLTVITGETGAGKSILISALNLVLGGRASTDVIRAGAEAATVEAVFDPGEAPELTARLADAGVALDGPLIVRRVLARNGRHRVYLNDTAVTLGTLAQVAGGALQVHAQRVREGLALGGRVDDDVGGAGGGGGAHVAPRHGAPTGAGYGMFAKTELLARCES